MKLTKITEFTLWIKGTAPLASPEAAAAQPNKNQKKYVENNRI